MITQDYGLAAMCLARGALPIHQDGKRYTAENIDALLLARHTAKRIRRAGGRLKGPAKRTPEQDSAFEKAFIQLLEEQQRLYDERARLKKEVRMIDTMKANVDDFLKPSTEQEHDYQRSSQRE